MGSENQFLSRSEFARSQGWSPSYVTKLGDQKRLVLSADGKKVDVAATLALLRKTEDPGKEAVRQRHQEGRVDKHVGAHVRPDAGDEGPAPAASSSPEYWTNKARREGNLADLAELELRKKCGELVEKARVEEAATRLGRLLRDAVFGVPTRLAPELASISDAFEVEQRLRGALRQVFDDIAKLTADDLGRAMQQH